MTNWGCPIPPAVWEAAPLQLPRPDRNMEGSLGQDLNVPMCKQPWNKPRRKQDIFFPQMLLVVHNQGYKSQGHPASSKCKALMALLGRSGLAGAPLWAGGQGSAIFFSLPWGSIVASTCALKNVFSSAEAPACGRVRQAAAGLHPRTKVAVLPGVGMESGTLGWARCVCVRVC